MARNLGQVIATLESTLSESGALGATEDALKSEQTAMDVAEGNAEVIEGVAEIDNMDTGIEDAFAAEAQVEKVLEAAEATMQEGGMSEAEAKILEVSLESILQPIGMGHRSSNFTQSPISTLESYSSNQTRGSATLVTIESIGNTLKTVASNIIRALKAALDTVIGFIAGILRNRAILAKHLDNLLAKANKIDTSKQKRSKESFKSNAGPLTVDGKASVATAERLIKDAGKLIQASSGLAQVVGNAKLSDESVGLVKAELSGEIAATSGRKLKVTEENGTINVTFDEGKKADSIEAPAKDQIVKLLKEAKSVVEGLKALDKIGNKFKESVKNVVSRLEELGQVARSKVGSDESKEKAAKSAETKKQARIARTILSKAGGSLPGAAFSAAKAVADYCAAGIRNYFGEGSEEAGGSAENFKPTGTAVALR